MYVLLLLTIEHLVRMILWKCRGLEYGLRHFTTLVNACITDIGRLFSLAGQVTLGPHTD